MGCGNAQEKLEDEMLNLKISRIELQMERYKQVQLLKETQGKDISISKIPDYIDPKFINAQFRRNSNATSLKDVRNSQIRRRSKSFKSSRSVISSNSKNSKNVKNGELDKEKRRKSKSVHIKMEKIDEEDPNAEILKAKRRTVILGRTNQ